MTLTHEGNNMRQGYSKVPPGACGSKSPDRCRTLESDGRPGACPSRTVRATLLSGLWSSGVPPIPWFRFFPRYARTWKTAFYFKVHLIEESLSQLRASHRVSQFAGMFLGLGLILRSYYLRELLACWLFFSLVFGLLALIVFGSVLAFCVGERVVHWARTATQVTPIVDFRPGKLRVKTILGVTRQRRDLPFRVPPAQHVMNKIRECLDVDSYLASSSVI